CIGRSKVSAPATTGSCGSSARRSNGFGRPSRSCAIAARLANRPRTRATSVRIAWFSPLPPMASGIADYSSELLPLVASRAEVEAFCPGAGLGRPVRAPAGIPVIRPQRFEERADRYDAVFYHLGNNPFHTFVYRASL